MTLTCYVGVVIGLVVAGAPALAIALASAQSVEVDGQRMAMAGQCECAEALLGPLRAWAKTLDAAPAPQSS
jgi:hypothetical protein